MSKDDMLSISPPIPAPAVINYRRADLLSYIHTNFEILDVLFKSLSRSLHLPPSTFSDMHRLSASSGCHVRFISAPPREITDSAAALGEHTDFGSLTILMNRLGGLQVQLPESGDWVYVRPIPGCAIVNLGDAMVKFTGGMLRSNLHRVVSPPGLQASETRYSLVYFSRPEHDVTLRRLKGGLVDEQIVSGEEAEEGVKSKDWLLRRAMGRKIEFFKGPESWENAKGTEGLRSKI
jgi:isopenicillin N synthase-like dioxygenase